MPLTIEEFSERLSHSQLMSEDEFRDFCASLDRPVQSASQLANELVKKKKLTEYQARSVYKGQTPRLVIGDYQILEKIGSGGMGDVIRPCIHG